MAPAEAGTAPGENLLSVEVAFSPAPREVDAVALHLPRGSTVADALQASGLLQRHGLSTDGLVVGLWGRVCAPDLVLRERDRVEIYRPLKVDPKEARRQRYKGKRGKPAASAAV